MSDGRRALVLGAGGVTGIAWEWGVLAGLAEAGLDLRDADLVVGTSAGSLVGAQVAVGIDPEVRYQAQLTTPPGDRVRAGRAVVARWAWAAARSRSADRLGARIGRLALATRTVSEAERRAVIEDRLPVRDWPERPLKVTAVDARSGAFAVFGRGDGVGLVDAVGASCAIPCVYPPVTIDGSRYIDGGVRSPANADLAAGYGSVVILAPSTRGLGPVTGAARQAEALRRAGARVAFITPDRAARRAFAGVPADPEGRAGAARAGRRQAPAAVEPVKDVWT